MPIRSYTNRSKEDIQREPQLYKPDVLEDLLEESELVVVRWKEVSIWSMCTTRLSEALTVSCA